MEKEYYVIRTNKMYVYNVHYIKGLFERIDFTIDKNVAEFYTIPDIRVTELMNYINEKLGCECVLESIDK